MLGFTKRHSMSSDLVFEILSEQLPRKTQEDSRAYLPDIVKNLLEKEGLVSKNICSYATPNRIILLAEKIELNDVNSGSVIKGPRVGSDEKAVNGFLKKVGRERKEELDVICVAGVDFYFCRKKEGKEGSSFEKVRAVMQTVIDRFPLHKKMKWGNGVGEWIRPVVNVLCVLGSKVVPVKVAGCTANNLTYGNLRFRKREHVVSSIEGYLTFLSDNLVIIDQDRRKQHILSCIDQLIEDKSLKYEKEDKIIDELNSMLEFPNILIGDVDESLLWIPKEVTLCVMTKHQRYLSLYNEEGKIVKFATVATVVNDNVRKTNERTLRARLADAAFLIEKDKKLGLEQHVEGLEKIVFKKELGNVLDKAKRITSLASYYAVWIPRASILSVNRAAMLAKADLSTLMVREFPELQGKIGRFYAKEAGEEVEVCDAIEEHYLPKGQGDRVTINPVSIAISLADKVDSLVGLMATETINGSRDPFALRRTAIALLRVIMENSINIPFDLMVARAVALYVAETKKNKNLKATYEVMKSGNIAEKVLDFCYDRLKVILKESFYLDREIINIVVGSCHDIVMAKRKIRIIGDYIKTEDGKMLLTAYRRIKNVVVKKEKSAPFSIKNIWNKCSEKLCVEPCEVDVYHKAKEKEGLLSTLLKENNFLEVMLELTDLSKAVISFMDGVHINNEDSLELHNHRVNLALWVVDLYEMVIDFSLIPKEV